MNPEFTLSLFAVLFLAFLCCLGKKPEEKVQDAPKQKKQVINIIDSVVQRSNFSNEDDKEGNDAISTLMALGYRKNPAKNAVGGVLLCRGGLTTEEIVKGALQRL